MKDIPLFILGDDGVIYEREGHRHYKDYIYIINFKDSKDMRTFFNYPSRIVFENRPDAVKQQIKQCEAFIKQTETKLNEVKERLEKLRGEL